MPRIDMDAIEDEWDDDPTYVPRARNLSPAARKRIDGLATARVVAVDRGRLTVVDESDEVAVPVEAALAGTMRHGKAAVGDRVRIKPARSESDVPRVVEVMPRESVLVRTSDDAVDDERVVVANADQIVVVAGADHLEAGWRLLDRIMVAAASGGMRAALCINKADVLTDRRVVDELVERYGQLDVESVITSAISGEGLDALHDLLTGKWSAFTGHSGVGKSSLFNRLVPDAEHAVGAVGKRGGRHTTVSSRAMPLASGGGWIIDSPGVRSFGLGVVDPRDLHRYFHELAELSCGLDDCVHDGEPGCTLTATTMHPERLVSYRRLLAALRGTEA